MHGKKEPIKWMYRLMAVWLLLFGLSFPLEAATVTDSFDSRVYPGRLDQYETVRVYHVEEEEQVPYVSVQEYLSLLYDDDIAFSMNDDGRILTATRNSINVEFDAAGASIRCSDWDAFFGSYGERALPNGLLHPLEFNAQAVSKVHLSTETAPVGFGIDLASYGLQMAAYDGKVLMPFAALQNIFAVPRGERVRHFPCGHHR